MKEGKSRESGVGTQSDPEGRVETDLLRGEKMNDSTLPFTEFVGRRPKGGLSRGEYEESFAGRLEALPRRYFNAVETPDGPVYEAISRRCRPASSLLYVACLRPLKWDVPALSIQ